MSQCTSMLPTITGAKKLQGYSTVNGDAGAIVDDKTKKQCSDMWTNAMSYTYGFCKLDFDMAADDATTAFNATAQTRAASPSHPTTACVCGTSMMPPQAASPPPPQVGFQLSSLLIRLRDFRFAPFRLL